MKKLSLSVCLAFAFFVASAVAQIAAGRKPGNPELIPEHAAARSTTTRGHESTR